MSDQPTGPDWKVLLDLVKESFEVVDLQILYRTVFGEALQGGPIKQVVLAVFDAAEKRGTWRELLIAVRGERPDRQDLRTQCDRVLGYLRPPAPAVSVGPPHKALVLLRQLPFVDRETVRETLMEMSTLEGWCGIVVNGPPRVGKSYCHELVTYLVNSSGPTPAPPRFVNLKAASNHQISPFELARNLFVSDAGLPTQLPGQSLERWAADIAAWVAICADKLPARVWLVLDGFDHPSVPEEMHEFVARLAEQARSRSTLRIVLLGYRRPLTEESERAFKRIDLEHLSLTELQSFFKELDELLGLRRKPGCADAVATMEQWLARFAGLTSADQRNEVLPSLLKLVPTLVASARKNGGGA